MKSNKKGFTLIEVLVVVSIIGLLASVVLVGLGGFRSQGRDAKRIADLKQVQNALELYYAQNQSYPASVAWGTLEDVFRTAGIGVSKIARDPLPGNPQYGYVSSGQSYVLSATLEDDKNAALKEDSDGSPLPGASCDDPVYCIEF